jgi:hypothetical protein
MTPGWIMRGCRFVLGLAFGWLCLVAPAAAILIETDAGRVGGFVVYEDGTRLKIRTLTADGQEKEEIYSQAKIKVLHRLEVKRLEALAKNNPKGYRDYAEELSRQDADPEARYTAMRLYLIAAYLAPDKYGTSSLLSMSRMASTPAEARKCRAMAFLLDPQADAAILEKPAGKPVQAAKIPAHALDDFTLALQHYRAGRINLAIDTAKHDGVDQVFGLAPGKIDQKTFLQWCSDTFCKTCKTDGTVACSACKGTGFVFNEFGGRDLCPTCNGKKRVLCPDCGGTHFHDPPEDAVRTVLRCELWALEQHAGGDDGRKEAADRKGWSAVLQARRTGPVLPLSLETITDFDPRKCRYRNGKWVEEPAP